MTDHDGEHALGGVHALVWQGPTSALTPTGIERTEEEDGCVHVLRLPAAGCRLTVAEGDLDAVADCLISDPRSAHVHPIRPGHP
jgi:hypothetical protein